MSPLASATVADRRVAQARRILRLVRGALPPGSGLELALDGDPSDGLDSRARVVINGPDALARMLWPPSADALGKAYLRGDIDIEGDIWAAVDAGRSFDLRRLGRDLPRLVRLGLRLRTGAPPVPHLRRTARLSGGATRGRATSPPSASTTTSATTSTPCGSTLA